MQLAGIKLNHTTFANIIAAYSKTRALDGVDSIDMPIIFSLDFLIMQIVFVEKNIVFHFQDNSLVEPLIVLDVLTLENF